MRIQFEVSGQSAEFYWSNWTGRTDLSVGGEKVVLQGVLEPSSHVRLGLTRAWRHVVDGQTIEIEKQRPRFFAGFRKNAFTVRVDDVVVAVRNGR